MLKGFKDFILRGNVVDLAVAVVIGAAFATIVTAFTDSIIKPLINAITPASSPGLGVTLIAGKDSTYVDFAAVITAAINFVIVAAVIYFAIVLPVNVIQERRRRGEEYRARRAHRGRAARRDPRSAGRPAAAFGSAPVVMRGSVVEQRVVVGRSALVALVAGHVG